LFERINEFLIKCAPHYLNQIKKIMLGGLTTVIKLSLKSTHLAFDEDFD